MCGKSAVVFKVVGSAYGGGGPLLSFIQPDFKAVTSDQGCFKANITSQRGIMYLYLYHRRDCNLLISCNLLSLVFASSSEPSCVLRFLAMITSSDSPSQLL